MSAGRNSVLPIRSLSGTEGELVSVRVSVDPRALEELLECLACLSFPINPQLYHGRPTFVEFPAFEGRLAEVRRALAAHGFDPESVSVRTMVAWLAG